MRIGEHGLHRTNIITQITQIKRINTDEDWRTQITRNEYNNQITLNITGYADEIKRKKAGGKWCEMEKKM